VKYGIYVYALINSLQHNKSASQSQTIPQPTANTKDIEQDMPPVKRITFHRTKTKLSQWWCTHLHRYIKTL